MRLAFALCCDSGMFCVGLLGQAHSAELEHIFFALLGRLLGF